MIPNAALNHWLKHLSRQALPAFAETTKCLAKMSHNRKASAADLAKVILQDSTMTSRILKMVNSINYNPTQKRIETVSHGIVVLGMDKIRNIAITVKFIEDLVKSDSLWQVQQETIIAFQAATQARRIAIKLGLEDVENVYIAALFQRLGPILFWCFPGNKLQLMTEEFSDTLPVDGAESALLGFTFNQLTEALIEQWHLTSLVGDYKESHPLQEAQQCVDLAYQLAREVHHGWDSPETQLITDQIAYRMDMDISEVQTWLFEGFAVAHKGLHALNIHPSMIPSIAPPSSQPTPVISPPAASAAPIQQEKHSCLRLLMHLLSVPIDIDCILLALLEGIKTDLQCEHGFILTRRGKKQELVLNHYLGQKSKVIASDLIAYLKQARVAELERLMASHFAFYSSSEHNGFPFPETKILGSNYFCFPISVSNKYLGYLFALRTAQAQPISSDDFDRFCHFSEHANVALRLHLMENSPNTSVDLDMKNAT